MDALDLKLLNLVQKQIPLVSRPYLVLGRQLGLTEQEVMSRLQRLLDAGLIRRLGPTFNSRKLGFYTTLCALKVPEERVREVAACINAFPGVTHNYLREHAYNMWFTLITPTRAEARAALEIIKEKTGITPVLDLPATRYFKLNVQFLLAKEEVPPGAD
jgi:DNA-binding Lrp family transcriptional regulator